MAKAASALGLRSGCWVFTGLWWLACADVDRLVPIPLDASPPVLTAPTPLDPTPTETRDGVPGPLPGVYRDLGPADPDAGIRSLVSFPIRDLAGLERTLAELYDPGHPSFRRYLTAAEWIARHAPHEEDVGIVADWLRQQGFQVPRIATNRLFLQFTGTVGQFNRAFGAQLRVLERKSPQIGNDPHPVYGLDKGIHAPRFVMERIAAVATADLAADTDPLRPEGAWPPTTLPGDAAQALNPEQVAHAYGLVDLYRRGFTGQGVRLGVTIGASIRFRDLEGFWRVFGIQRAPPRLVETMEPPATRYREGALDVEWAGAMAPGAELIVYTGPDARNTSMIFTFNEAIARHEVSVITDSFAHREDSEPPAVREAYGASALMGAALGITLVAASGDSGGVDTPSSSPHVTAVGGTVLRMNGNTVEDEVAWYYSGSGLSRTFKTPLWQQGLPGLQGKRAVADVALNAETYYWYAFLGDFRPNTGTSFGSPIFGAMVAVVNGARAAEGKPPVGSLNPLLYTSTDVQRTFRDITVGRTHLFSAGPGWDLPTGWGAPDAAGLLRTLP